MAWDILPIASTRRSGGGEIYKTTGQGHRSERDKNRLSLSFRIRSRIVYIPHKVVDHFLCCKFMIHFLLANWGPYFFSRIKRPIARWEDIFFWSWKQANGLYPWKRRSRRRRRKLIFPSSYFNSGVVTLLPIGGFGLQDGNKLNKTLTDLYWY
jgi:hypothetical protein